MNAFGITLLIIGVIIVVFAAINLIIVVKQQRELLLTQLIISLTFALIGTLLGTYMIINEYKIKEEISHLLSLSLKFYNSAKRSSKSTRLVWDNYMTEHSCCGLESSIGDFFNSEWFDVNNAKYHFPSACCPREIRALYNYPHCPTISRYSEGCLQHIWKEYEYPVYAGFYSLLASIILLFVVTIATIQLKRKMEKDLLYLF